MHDGRMKSSGEATASAASEIGVDDALGESRAALETSFRAHFRELVGMLKKRVRDPETARDLAQSAFERLAARVEAPQALRDPRAHLMQVARNLSVDHLRRERLERGHEKEAALAADGLAETRTPEETVLHRQRLDDLDAIIRGLPAMRRRIFILNRLHGLSIDAIADQEGLSRRAVRGHIERAMADIRARMRDTGAEGGSMSGGRS